MTKEVTTMTIEIFTADCPVCRETIDMVKEAECCQGAEITTHTCSGDTCCRPAQQYKITALPTIVVDGHVAIEGRPSMQELREHVAPYCDAD